MSENEKGLKDSPFGALPGETRQGRFDLVVRWRGEEVLGVEIIGRGQKPVEPHIARQVIDLLEHFHPRNTFVYVGFSEARQLWKIGYSSDKERRASELGITLEHYLVCSGSDAGREAERLLHNLFKDCRVKGEWFNLSPEDVNLVTAIQDANDLVEFRRIISIIDRARREKITLRYFPECNYYNEAQFRVK